VVSTPSEKYESQLGLFFPIYGWKNKKKSCSKPPISHGLNKFTPYKVVTLKWLAKLVNV